MMIALRLPDWSFELKIYIMSGIELVAVKDAETPWWKVKSQRCRMCGECCVEYCNCGHLVKLDGVRVCSIGAKRPFFCSMWFDDDATQCNQRFEVRVGGAPAINLGVPDWAAERDMFILSALELVAYKPQNASWRVKTSRCSYCGDCCEKKGCSHLVKHPQGRQCDLGLSMPYECCVAHDGGARCTQKFKEVL